MGELFTIYYQWFRQLLLILFAAKFWENCLQWVKINLSNRLVNVSMLPLMSVDMMT